jgi:hypothetical protein
MNKILATLFLITATPMTFASSIPKEFQISSIEIIETTHLPSFKNNNPGNVIADALNQRAPNNDGKKEDPKPETPPKKETPKPVDINQVGKVISVAKDFVALGESIYTLAKKGKPTNTTQYVAISVVPTDPMTKEFISPFDLEGFSVPEQRSFTAKVKNGNDSVVVQFDYQLVFSYGGSYDGKGKYLTGVMVIPKSIHTKFGWDFNATMKLDAIMNHGSKEDPIAGALVTIKYQMNSWTTSFERNDTIHLTGQGKVKSFGIQ